MVSSLKELSQRQIVRMVVLIFVVTGSLLLLYFFVGNIGIARGEPMSSSLPFRISHIFSYFRTSGFMTAVILLASVTSWLCVPPKISTVPTASGHLPLIGNSVSYGLDPIGFLKARRAKHGDVFMVNLAIIKIVFFLGPDATNQFYKGTDQQGISFTAVWEYVFGKKIYECTFLFLGNAE